MNCETLLAGGTQNHIALVVNTTTDKVCKNSCYLVKTKWYVGKTKLEKTDTKLNLTTDTIIIIIIGGSMTGTY